MDSTNSLYSVLNTTGFEYTAALIVAPFSYIHTLWFSLPLLTPSGAMIYFWIRIISRKPVATGLPIAISAYTLSISLCLQIAAGTIYTLGPGTIFWWLSVTLAGIGAATVTPKATDQTRES